MDPEKIGHYKIICELGRGAMGVVYKARDTRKKRTVAIKILDIAFDVTSSESQKFLVRFQREAIAARTLKHPNMIFVHSVDQENDKHFIVMEYVDGFPLSEFTAPPNLLSVKDSVNVVAQIADALDCAHKNGIVHRDVKPENIILTKKNIAKITDFGLAHFSDSKLTVPGTLIGSPNYMSPEQILGLKADARSDIFSLGVVLYEILTGESAFPGNSLNAIKFRIVKDDPVPPKAINRRINGKLNKIVIKALDKDPENRFQAASDLNKELLQAL